MLKSEWLNQMGIQVGLILLPIHYLMHHLQGISYFLQIVKKVELHIIYYAYNNVHIRTYIRIHVKIVATLLMYL